MTFVLDLKYIDQLALSLVVVFVSISNLLNLEPLFGTQLHLCHCTRLSSSSVPSLLLKNFKQHFIWSTLLTISTYALEVPIIGMSLVQTISITVILSVTIDFTHALLNAEICLFPYSLYSIVFKC